MRPHLLAPSPVSGSVGQSGSHSVVVSAFRDSYRIYRACKLVRNEKKSINSGGDTERCVSQWNSTLSPCVTACSLNSEPAVRQGEGVEFQLLT